MDRDEGAVSHAGATTLLAAARRAGEASYGNRLAELERLVTARVAALTRPGPVLLDLAVRGFGVQLPPTPVNDNPVKPEEVRNARRS